LERPPPVDERLATWNALPIAVNNPANPETPAGIFFDGQIFFNTNLSDTN
jgi:hypothetical protein